MQKPNIDFSSLLRVASHASVQDAMGTHLSAYDSPTPLNFPFFSRIEEQPTSSQDA